MGKTMNKLSLSVLSLTAMGLGIYFANIGSNVHVNEISLTEHKSSELQVPLGQNTPVSSGERKPASVNYTVTGKDNKDDKWTELSQNKGVHLLYQATKDKFNSSRFKEPLAKWVASGLVFDDSSAYGSLLNDSINKLNEDPEVAYKDIATGLNHIGAEDHFMRAMLINLVDRLHVSKELKIDFFESQSVREVVLNEKGHFTPDSLNITTAIIFLKKNGADESRAKQVYESALSNNSSQQVRDKLKSRFESYFPTI
jgi:hypothetical protein